MECLNSIQSRSAGTCRLCGECLSKKCAAHCARTFNKLLWAKPGMCQKPRNAPSARYKTEFKAQHKNLASLHSVSCPLQKAPPKANQIQHCTEINHIAHKSTSCSHQSEGFNGCDSIES